MSLLDRIDAARHPERSYPVGAVEVSAVDRSFGRDDSLFSPPEYGDYIATSNDIYSVVMYKARAISRLRLRGYFGRGLSRVELDEHPLLDLLRTVNPHWSWKRLILMTQVCMGLWGECMWVIVNDRRGRPAELWWVRPDRMRPIPHPDDYLAGYVYEATTGERITFPVSEVVWFRYPNPLDEYTGLSPLAAARLSADTARDAMKANQGLYKNGWNIGGLVLPPAGTVYSVEDAKNLETALSNRFKGADKGHRWAVMRFRADVQNMGVTPKDAEFIAGMDITFRQVCRAYGVPSPLLNDLEHATLANVREFQIALWDTLAPEADTLAADIDEQLTARYADLTTVEFDYTKIPALQQAATETWDRERGQLEQMVITINEWRAAKGMPPVPWGDQPWAPVNKMPLGEDGLPLQPATTSTGGA